MAQPLKTDYLESGHFCLDFKQFFYKMEVICPDFKWSGFQIPFDIRTIYKPMLSYQPFEIHTSPDFKSPL